ncbi:hypothetical protein [Acetobacter aceti]|uniref:Uncharacterized protein n=1 Tax=Acetobacter aceti TaxID=435 RepID=A0A6S6PP84_ACEAC|nr:hypothetical protein [Acetobacter aceti]BCI68586.1 hypothetical protein AAJCM20276_32100 [Acetobacter aceti]
MARASVMKAAKAGKTRLAATKSATASGGTATARKSRASKEDLLSEVEVEAAETPVEVVVPVKVAPVPEALYFDAEWYLETYPDVAGAGIDPATHYQMNGFREGRNPNAAFDGKAYLAANPDLEGYSEDLFAHYVFFGASEGRRIKR